MSAHRAVPMKKRRARELVPEEREDTCRSHRADTAAGGAGVEWQWGTRRDSLWGEVGWGSIRNYRGTCYRVGEGVFSSRFSSLGFVGSRDFTGGGVKSQEPMNSHLPAISHPL
jgi:hypothetical protein